jgi:hypothetical protein
MGGLTPEQLDPSRNHCARLGALRLGWSLWAEYYLRPNGEVIVVGEDDDQPDLDVVHTDRLTVLKALVWGSRQYPELLELLPTRPPTAVDCICRQVPIFASGKVICPKCAGLGWITPSEDELNNSDDPNG